MVTPPPTTIGILTLLAPFIKKPAHFIAFLVFPSPRGRRPSEPGLGSKAFKNSRVITLLYPARCRGDGDKVKGLFSFLV